VSAVARRARHEGGQGDTASLARRLTLLGNRMLRLAEQIERRGHGAAEAGDSDLFGLLAEEAYRDRRRRAQHLPHRLLGEPAWDILLDLYVAAGRGEAVSVSNACRAADAPPSTALRWLQHLEHDGLVERVPDPKDGRRHFARLTRRGSERMDAYFVECRADLVDELGIESASALAER
jgi:DNA-binding MarR family transcriptional regulator